MLSSTYIDGFTVNTTSQDICNSQNKNKKYDNYISHWTWQILTATVFHSTHNFHKFIGEQTVLNFKIKLNYITLKSHTHTPDKIFTLLKVLPIKLNLILKSGISFSLHMSLNVLLHTSQRYGRSPVRTHWCTFRLLLILNVYYTHHSNMDTPQYVWISSATI
jgi:hypothetical protein